MVPTQQQQRTLNMGHLCPEHSSETQLRFRFLHNCILALQLAWTRCGNSLVQSALGSRSEGAPGPSTGLVGNNVGGSFRAMASDSHERLAETLNIEFN